MDGVTIILGLIMVGVLAAVVLWFTRNKGVVGKRVVVGESTQKITGMAQDSIDTDPADDWEVVPVTRVRRGRGQEYMGGEGVPELLPEQPVLAPLSVDRPLHAEQRYSATTSGQSAMEEPPGRGSARAVRPPTEPDAVHVGRGQKEGQEPPLATPRELIVVLNIIASDEQWLDGPCVVNAVRSAGMQYGDPGIFHYVSSTNSQDEPLFSLANILNPGIFKMDEIEQLTTPGVTLFMRLTGTAATMDGLDAFTRMHDTAQQLARALNAEVYDERRLRLTEATALRLRDKIVQHQHNASAY